LGRNVSTGLVSVIIVNYNGGDTLLDCIMSISHSRGVGEIFLIDNCSNDGSLKLADKCIDSRLNTICLKANIGLSAARNLGAARAVSKYLAFVDQDSRVDQNWLEEPVALLERHEEIGAVQCVFLYPTKPDVIWSFGRGLDQRSWDDLPSKVLKSYSTYRHVLYPVGAGFVVKRDIWQLIGGEDTDFFVGYDDLDLGIRLWLAGYEVVSTPKAIVYHAGGTSRLDIQMASTWKFYRIKNILSTWAKNLSCRTLVRKVLPFSLAIPLLALLMAGPWGIVAICAFLRDLGPIFRKRALIQRYRRINDQRIMTGLEMYAEFPSRVLVDYAKAGLHRLTRTLRLSLGPGPRR
jgi:GT2 family glycosyltransferase